MTPVRSRRDFIRYSLLAGGYSLTAGSALLAPIVRALGKVPSQLNDSESIFTLTGKVTVNGKLAQPETIIKVNSTIETAKNSQLIFVIGKDAHILHENSKVIISGENNNLETGLQIAKGKIASVFGKRTANQPALQMTTTTATVGIRGTGVYVEVDDEQSYICTCYGSTDIKAIYDPQSQERVTTIHHDSPRYIAKNGKTGQFIQPAPMKNHGDEEMALIEALVGRTTPF